MSSAGSFPTGWLLLLDRYMSGYSPSSVAPLFFLLDGVSLYFAVLCESRNLIKSIQAQEPVSTRPSDQCYPPFIRGSMLSRASSDAGARLRRSKSTTTVPHRSQLLAPPGADLARQHALAAATTAFVRAHVADEAEWEHSRRAEPSRTKSTQNKQTQGRHFLQRESSSRASTSQKPKQPLRHQSQPSLAFSRVPTCSPEGQSTTVMSENLRPVSQFQQTPQHIYTSSSSQEIRKARSIHYASSVQTGSPIPRPPAKYLTTPPATRSIPGISARSVLSAKGSTFSFKSMGDSVQRPSGSAVIEHLSRGPCRTTLPNESLDKARDKCLQEFQQQRQVRQRPSLFLAPFRKRNDNTKMNVHEADSSAMGLAIQQDMQMPKMDSKFLKEKRSISGSLKNKFRKVFRRSSYRSNTVPIQQMPAARDYFGYQSAATPSIGGTNVSSAVPPPDEKALHHVRSRSSSLERGHPVLGRSSSRGSNRSLRSDAGMSHATSRLSSWGNSSIAETITQRTAKRLTVIHETKDSMDSHAGAKSASGNPRRDPPTPPTLAAFRDPMPVLSMMADGNMAVDPKRVFSALMKEIDTKNVQTDHDTEQKLPNKIPRKPFDSASRIPRSIPHEEILSKDSTVIGSNVNNDLPKFASSRRQTSISMQSKHGSLKSSSLKSLGRALIASIRTVTPSDPTAPPFPAPDSPRSVRGPVRIPRSDSDVSSMTEGPQATETSFQELHHGTTDLRIRPHHNRPMDSLKAELFVPTRDQIDGRMQKWQGRWKTPLEDNDLFHLPSAENHVSVNTDKDGIRRSPEKWEKPGYSPQHTPRASGIFSPSVYSRNTDGMSILPKNSVISFDDANEEMQEHSPTGSAIIITSQSVKSFVVGTPKARRASGSLRNSRDWKAWLSHEISELASLPKEEIAIHNHYQVPQGTGTSHRRESAQISEDEDIADTQGTEQYSQSVAGPDSEGLETSIHQRISIDSITRKERESSPLALDFSTNSLLSQSSSSRQTDLSHQKCLEDIHIHQHALSADQEGHFPHEQSRSQLHGRSPSSSEKSVSLDDIGCLDAKQPSDRNICADFSVPVYSRAPTQAGNSERIEGNKENLRGIIHAISPCSKVSILPGPGNHLQALRSSTSDRATSLLSDTSSATAQHRIRVRTRPVSPEKLIVRPKSAFDLRTEKPPPLTSLPVSTQNSPRKRELLQSSNHTGRRPIVTRLPYSPTDVNSPGSRAFTGSPVGTPLPIRSAKTPKRSYLPPGSSTSSLALNKEPLPGEESLAIDAVLGGGIGDRLELRSGSVTPGQRMADRFIKERSAKSATGSPAHGGSVDRSVTGSPAFV